MDNISNAKKLQHQRDTCQVHVDVILKQLSEAKKSGKSEFYWKCPDGVFTETSTGFYLNGIGNTLSKMLEEEGLSSKLSILCSGGCDYGCSCKGTPNLKIYWY
jgi:hypothetical protein